MVLIGVDIGASSIKAGRVRNNVIVKYTKRKIHKKDTTQDILEKLFEILDKLVTHKVKYIGIGVPGLVTEAGNVLELRNIFSWESVPLKALVQKKYKVPVFVNNDANCFVLGEKYFGKAKKYKNVVGVIMGSGAGAGIIVNNELYSGLDSGAGQFGNIAFRHKTVEDYCSGKYFLWKYHLTGVQAFNNVLGGNHKALEMFKEYGKNVGEELAIVIDALAPELIILGGYVAKSFRFFKKSMLKTLKEKIPKDQFRKLKIKASIRRNMGLLGAAVLYKDYIMRWKK